MSTAPVLRWLSTSSLTSSRPSSRPSSPTLDALDDALHDALHDALNDDLPAFPPTARLPSSFYVSRSLRRPPPFLGTVSRSTLPTASLSPESLVLTHPPHRSSIDSLRSLHDRRPPDPALFKPTTANNWWWFQNDSPEPLLTEDDTADDFRKKYRSPRNPVVFCHGLLGFDSVTIGPAIAPMQVAHWRGIKEVLEANGTEVLITRVPATSSPVVRAKVLEARISEAFPGRSVHLIGHSMGGLDCRYLTTHLKKRKFRVLSITTIATPHRGSSFADYFLSTIGPSRLPSFLSLLDLLPNGGGDGTAFESLTLESMRRFNEEVPDVPGVRYFSWGAMYDPGLIDTWKWSHSIILEREGPNDGLVSVESSKWGTYLGTLAHVNHLDLVGWINTARYKWAEMMGKEIKFHPATFYLGIADMLAREVDGVGQDDGGTHEGDGVEVGERDS